MKTIFTVGAVVLATCLLSGCVNEQKVNQLASNVQTLNAKIARLEQDMKALRPQIYAAKSEANRANTRLDAQDYFACVSTQNDKKITGSVSVAGDIFKSPTDALGRFFAPAFTGRDCVDDAFFAVAGV